MKRTSFLSLLGLAAASPALAKVPVSSPPRAFLGEGLVGGALANKPLHGISASVSPYYKTLRFVSVADGGEIATYTYVGGGGWVKVRPQIGDSMSAHMAAYE